MSSARKLRADVTFDADVLEDARSLKPNVSALSQGAVPCRGSARTRAGFALGISAT
ncbi:post-segregation antitoxin (ccd killing protein) [Rubellimicrobium aerolatum]|nr:post-segregation antitoxin (ccd killing protein) [Rubellimicrobium aerolatum]